MFWTFLLAKRLHQSVFSIYQMGNSFNVFLINIKAS